MSNIIRCKFKNKYTKNNHFIIRNKLKISLELIKINNIGYLIIGENYNENKRLNILQHYSL